MNVQFERRQWRDDAFALPGPFSDSKLPPTQSTLLMEKGGGGVLIWGRAMGIGPHNRGTDNVLPSPDKGNDELFDALRPALEELAGLQISRHRETNDLLLL